MLSWLAGRVLRFSSRASGARPRPGFYNGYDSFLQFLYAWNSFCKSVRSLAAGNLLDTYNRIRRKLNLLPVLPGKLSWDSFLKKYPAHIKLLSVAGKLLICPCSAFHYTNQRAFSCEWIKFRVAETNIFRGQKLRSRMGTTPSQGLLLLGPRL